MLRDELIERRHGVIARARQILTSNEHNGNFNPRTDPAYTAIEREMADLDLQIRQCAGDTRRRAIDPRISGYAGGHNERAGMSADDEARIRSFAEFCATGQHNSGIERRALNTQTGSAGGVLVPTFVSQGIVQDLVGLESIRRGAPGAPGAFVRPVDGDTNVPMIDDASAAYYSEAATDAGISDTAPTFGSIEHRPTLLVCRVPIKWHLLNRSATDISQELRRSFARGIAKTENAKFLATGTGTAQPQALIAAGPAVTTANSTVIEATEIDLLAYGMPAEHFNQSVWIVAPQAAAQIRELATSAGHPLVAPDRADGLLRLHGRPLIWDSYMPAPTAGLKPVVLADLNAGYEIAEETDLVTLVDPYSRSKHAETVITIYKFGDGRIRRAGAVQTLRMKP